jgi:IS30 family transposase
MRSFHHFILKERDIIMRMLLAGDKVYKIAQALGRHPSSVYREIKRSKSSRAYNSWYAHSLYSQRREKCIRKFRLSEAEELEYVRSNLEKGWTPEQIAARWKMEHPEAQGIGKGTIYRAVEEKLFGEKITPKTHLRRGGKPRGKTNRATIKPDKRIEYRPLIINERGRLGDLEGDTLHGGIGKGCLVTLVDRRNRKLRCSSHLDERQGIDEESNCLGC